MTSRPLRPVIAGLLLALAAACGGGTEPTAITGVYGLDRADGKPVPAVVVQSGPRTVTVGTGELVLHPSGGFVQSARVVETISGTSNVMDDEHTGTWTRSGAQITLSEGGAATVATLGAGFVDIPRTIGGQTVTLRYIR